MDCLITVLQFFFISTSNNINPKEFRFYFGSEKDSTEHKLDEMNRISFKPIYKSPVIYYVETITVKYKDIELFFFQFFVYIGKNNNIIIDLDEKRRPSFELLFYAKESIYNPIKISYKNKEYTQLENYGNKFRSRIFFANVDPEQLQYINCEKIKESNEFYQLAEQTLAKIVKYPDLSALNTNSVKYLTESFSLSGRLDAEYYQPKYDVLFDSLKKIGTKKLGGTDGIVKF